MNKGIVDPTDKIKRKLEEREEIDDVRDKLTISKSKHWHWFVLVSMWFFATIAIVVVVAILWHYVTAWQFLDKQQLSGLIYGTVYVLSILVGAFIGNILPKISLSENGRNKRKV